MVACVAVMVLAAGCTGSASVTPAPKKPSGPTPAGAASRAMTSTSSSKSQAPASHVAVVRCAKTPNVAPSATVQWNVPVVGGEPTIKAGQAVAFVTTGPSPTVTEGTNGKPAKNACIDKTIGSKATAMELVVTFYKPGDYNITCRNNPAHMHTVVHVI
jgi:plastocyanin